MMTDQQLETLTEFCYLALLKDGPKTFTDLNILVTALIENNKSFTHLHNLEKNGYCDKRGNGERTYFITRKGLQHYNDICCFAEGVAYLRRTAPSAPKILRKPTQNS